MAANESPIVATLRQEIERKYKEALQALETLSGYIGEQSPPAVTGSSSAVVKSVERTVSRNSNLSNVDIVYGALTTGEYKTVEQIHASTGLAEERIRAVLYAKAAKKRLNSKNIGKLKGFCLKTPSPAAQAGGQQITTASLVRDVFAKHPAGLSTSDVVDKLSDDLNRIGGNRKAVSAAIFHMKETGNLAYDESTGIYRPTQTAAAAVH